jgi:hypothetical protein
VNQLIKKRLPKRDLTKAAESFGSWSVAEWLGWSRINKDHYYRCICVCGQERQVPGKNLIRRLSQSCGCKVAEVVRSHRWKGHGGISGSYWYAVRKDAGKRGHDFEISIEYAWSMFVGQQSRCAFTNLELTTTGDYGRGTASLDRKDSRLGYVVGNVHWVHRDINLMKNVLTVSRFLELCRLVAENGAINV